MGQDICGRLCPFKACLICKIENPAIEPQPLTLFEDDE